MYCECNRCKCCVCEYIYKKKEERWLRKDSLELVGVYHSHPEGDALPSCTDIARAWEPNLIWLITAVKNGSAQTTKGYLLAESLSKFEEAQLKIISNESSYV